MALRKKESISLTNELDMTNIYKKRDELHRFSDERRIIWDS